MSRGWKVALGVVGVIIAVNAALTLLGSLTGGTPGGPRSSSYATGGDGLAAYASLVARAGHPVRRLRAPAAKTALDPAATLVLLDPAFPTPDDSRALARFVAAGGRLVAGGTESEVWLRRIVAHAPAWSPDGVRDAFALVPIPEPGGRNQAEAAAGGFWVTPGSALPAVAGGGRTLLAVATIGAGRVLLLADASPLDNDLLGEADNAAFGLGLAGPRNRPVVFAESYHGYGKSSGVAAIPTRWKTLLVLGILAGLVLMLARGRRLGPAEPEERELAPPRRDYVDALASLIGRARDRPAVIAALEQRARTIVMRSTGSADLRGATALGLEPAELGALLQPDPGDAGLVDAGRALARLERAARRRFA
jgi:hypothetical protein